MSSSGFRQLLADEYLPWCLGLGATFFVIGEIGNLVHHIYLAALRPKDIEADDATAVQESYRIPHTGLFSKVVCPLLFRAHCVARNCSDGAGNSRLLGVSKHD